MPIGKNALKRVENNGYSKVESSAPDMENSSVIANIDQQVVDKIIAPVEAKAKAKRSAKAPAAVVEEKPVEVKVPAKRKYTRKTVEQKAAIEAKPKRKYTKKAAKPAEKEGFERVQVGEGMPYYLL